MTIEFKSEGLLKNIGFSANIYFTTIPNKECESWLDMNKKTLKSPNYPQQYHNYKKCSWLITVDHYYHIILDISEFCVRYQKIINSDLFQKYIFCKYFFEIQIEADAGYLTIYDGGSEHAEIIGNLNGAMNDTKMSTPRNQIFVVLDTNGKNNASMRLNTTVIKSKYLV